MILMPNFLLHFIRFPMIDMRPNCSLLCSMRWMVLFALAAFLSAMPAIAQEADRHTKTPTRLPDPTAEPANDVGYDKPLPPEKQGPTAADRGPVQKHFVIASDLDDPNAPSVNANMPLTEKVALDKHISVSKIHDVQNDSSYKGGSNNALLYEIKYLNWGAVTGEQLAARQGTYLTISWENNGPKSDFTAMLQYRQIKSQEVVRTLVQKMPHVSGTVRSYFAVVDKAYHAYGPVCSWRFVILKGDTVVAESKSYLW